MAVGLGDATAKGWPTPAAGESASGDVEIVLTFDDGPNPKTTPHVLDILKEHHLHAIFFMVGDMAGSKDKRVPPLVARILAEGHAIGTHTMTHADLCKVKEDKAAREIDLGRETIEKVAHYRTAWFRTPYGVRCNRLEAMLDERHLQHFHWDLDPQEWKHKDVQKTVKYVTGAIGRATGRDVLLMHDIHEVTVKALPEILKFVDEENVRRQKSHKKPIRFLEPSALAVEQLPPGLVDWFKDATSGVRELPKMVASVLP